MNIAGHLARMGRAFGDTPALALGRRIIASYAELAQTAAALAGAMRGHRHLMPGDRVALVMRNCPAFIEMLYACWHAGLVAVPINAKLHRNEFAYILENSGAAACFVTTELAGVIGGLGDTTPALRHLIDVSSPAYRRMKQANPLPLAERQPDDLAWLFYTSGTTGVPKGAMLTHRNLLVMSAAYVADVAAITHQDCILHAAPLSHGSGLYAVPYVMGGALNVVPESGGFDEAEIFEHFRDGHRIAMFAAPTMVKRLVCYAQSHPVAIDGLAAIIYGGGPMYLADLKQAMACLGNNRLVQIYGQGESPMTITVLPRAVHEADDHPRHDARLASVGVPYAVVEVRVADGDDRALPCGELGEVLVRGDCVMPGYWQNPDASAATLRNGWLHTGDIGSFDEDGFLTLRDRSKDLIISGGSNIYPREVEEVLLRHTAVAEVAVIGRPHAEWGEEVVAFIVAAPGTSASPAALDAWCLEHLARFKRPRRYEFIDALPKNNYGKVTKTTLRERLAP